VDWSRIFVFWGDERCVPPTHPDSNYRMACEAWLQHVPIPEENINRMVGELSPQQAAAAYEIVLRAFFADEAAPPFDLVLLGLGNDAHTASLFPGTQAVNETDRWVVGQYVEKLGVWRLTLTPSAINGALNVTFLVSGLAKAAPLKQVLTAPYAPERLPAQVVQPQPGGLLWLVDEAAASELDLDADLTGVNFH
jgi:6-phosphogluconolactonase